MLLAGQADTVAVKQMGGLRVGFVVAENDKFDSVPQYVRNKRSRQRPHGEMSLLSGIVAADLLSNY